MGTKESFGVSVDPGLKDRVEDYRDRREHPDRSDAVAELLKTGLNEREAPILYRIKDLAIESAWYLGLLALVSVIFGHTTDALHPAHGIQLAIVFLALAAALVAVVEIAREASGWRDAIPFGGS